MDAPVYIFLVKYECMPTKQMYEIKLVETEKKRVKIHYVGYSNKYDESKLKSEIVYQPLPADRDEIPQFSFFFLQNFDR